jgi:CheY-like chemotaxis protein
MAGEPILIVEDNEKNRKLERDILQFHGYRTIEADAAEEGIRLARATPPALILMDIQLPGMNGIAPGAAAAPRSTRAKLPDRLEAHGAEAGLGGLADEAVEEGLGLRR